LTDVKFSSKPEREIIYQVGDRVEVYCDHEKDGERTRGWLAGVVVQADAKMVAVQFKESVYLTDGWMVPDHVLWSTQKSSTIRYIQTRRRRPRPMKKDD
jgi:hypothetical protein